jgi:ribosomal protein S12
MVLLKNKKSYRFMFPCFFYYFTLNIMPTIQQLVRSARQKMTNKTKAPALKCPQRRSVCTRVYTQKRNRTHAKLRVYV